MDPRIREVMETAMGNCANDLKQIEPLIDQKMGTVLETCYGKNTSNVDRFADCILQKNRKLDDVMKLTEFKILFFSKSANNCLVSGKSLSDCTNDVVKGIKEMIQSTTRNIQKL